MRRSIPPSAIPLMISSITEGTLKQYTGCYRKYWNFCNSINRDPLTFDLNNYLEFITTEFSSGLSYSVMNSYRSALNFLFPLNDKDEKTVNRCLKGMYHSKPPTPKYSFTWNPEPVLLYLSKLYPLESLSIESLTQKLVTLIALTTAHRVQTISKISLENIVKYDQKIQIKITDRIKTSGPNKLQPLLIFPYFTNKPELCVASTIDFYIESTSLFREKYKQLILTHKKPIHPASCQTISRWIRVVLKNSGINTTLFSSHSVRHAATSAAFRSGVNVDTIKNTAGWSASSNTFFNFYNKTVGAPNDIFAKEVLNLV